MNKNNFKFISILLLALLLQNCTKERNQKVTVEHDCTGIYLLLSDKAYKICNLETVAAFPDGAIVTATFKKIKDCNNPAYSEFTCRKLYPYESWIEVEDIQ